jgi:hypothetical protein
MGLIASEKSGGDFELTEQGIHIAICYGVIDLGHQHNEKYQKDEHKFLIQWELPNVRIDVEKDGETTDKPRAISRKFTLSLGLKSHLRPFLESWRGKAFTGLELAGFDISNLIGVNCQLQVLHEKADNGKTYANVKTALPIQKGSEKLEPENPTQYYSIEDSGLKLPDNIPNWIEEIIMKSREWTDQGMSEMNYPDDHGMEEPPIHGEPPIDESEIPF